MLRSILTVAIALVGLMLAACHAPAAPAAALPSSRPFAMGTILWLPMGAATPQPLIDVAVGRTIDASDHLLVQLPWSPAQTNTAELARWIATIARDTHRGLTIAIDWQEPTRQGVRDGGARTDSSGNPATRPWSFADPAVRAAFIASAVDAARTHHPQMLVLGVEVNYYARTHPDDFRAFVSVYREARAQVQTASPATRVLVTFQYELLAGRDHGWGGKPDRTPVDAFDGTLDVLGLSVYPHPAGDGLQAVTPDYLSWLLDGETGSRPWGVLETAWPTTSHAGEPAQAAFARKLLEMCRARGASIVIWTSTLDTAIGPEVDADRAQFDAASQWMHHLGLWTIDGRRKPAAEEWMRWRELPHMNGTPASN